MISYKCYFREDVVIWKGKKKYCAEWVSKQQLFKMSMHDYQE